MATTARADRTFTVHEGQALDEVEGLEDAIREVAERALDEPAVDAETGEVVGRKILRWVELPAHLDTGRWKRVNGGLEVVVPAECDDPMVTTITAGCRVEMSGVLLADATVEGGTWRRDPDNAEAIIYKFNLVFAAIEGPLVLARLASLASRDELRGVLRLGIRHQQLGLDLPDGREVSLTARAGEGEARVDVEGARDVTPDDDRLDEGGASSASVEA